MARNLMARPTVVSIVAALLRNGNGSWLIAHGSGRWGKGVDR